MQQAFHLAFYRPSQLEDEKIFWIRNRELFSSKYTPMIRDSVMAYSISLFINATVIFGHYFNSCAFQYPVSPESTIFPPIHRNMFPSLTL
jgi:hypothetical protein